MHTGDLPELNAALEEGRGRAEQKVKEAAARTEAAEARAETAQEEEMKVLSITATALHKSGMDAERIVHRLNKPVAVIHRTQEDSWTPSSLLLPAPAKEIWP